MTTRCLNCDTEVALDCGDPVAAARCPHCEAPLPGTAPPAGSAHAASAQRAPTTEDRLFSRVSDRIAHAAGVQPLAGFSFRETFSEVFARHSDEEVERYFAVGGPDTTPSLAQIEVRWPRPWVFFRMFLLALLTYIAFVQAWKQFHNLNLLPGLIMVGSFAVPFATLVLFFEFNIRRNISLYQVSRLLMLGGITGIVLSLLMYQIADSFHMQWLGASVAGIVEETGKLLVLGFVVNKRKYRSILNGLLLGAAVGTGFAAFESAGYALRTALNDGTSMMREVILSRGLLSPFGHIVWTGMCAAALWRVKGDAPFRLQMLKDPRFLRVFAAAVLLHMLWDSPLQLPFYGTYLILGAIAWIIVLGLVQEGLEDLRARRAAALAAPAATT